jgi:hypothetical protein
MAESESESDQDREMINQDQDHEMINQDQDHEMIKYVGPPIQPTWPNLNEWEINKLVEACEMESSPWLLEGEATPSEPPRSFGPNGPEPVEVNVVDEPSMREQEPTIHEQEPTIHEQEPMILEQEPTIHEVANQLLESLIGIQAQVDTVAIMPPWRQAAALQVPPPPTLADSAAWLAAQDVPLAEPTAAPSIADTSADSAARLAAKDAPLAKSFAALSAGPASWVPPQPPPPPPRRPPGTPGPIGKPGTRRRRPRGAGGETGKSATANWHECLARATKRGPSTLWMFRFKYPHPNEMKTHAEWVQSLRDHNFWPTFAQLRSDEVQMWYPKLWRHSKYRECTTMDEFLRTSASSGAKRVAYPGADEQWSSSMSWWSGQGSGWSGQGSDSGWAGQGSWPMSSSRS